MPMEAGIPASSKALEIVRTSSIVKGVQPSLPKSSSAAWGGNSDGEGTRRSKPPPYRDAT